MDYKRLFTKGLDGWDVHPNQLTSIQKKFINTIIEQCKQDEELLDFISSAQNGKTTALVHLNRVIDESLVVSLRMLNATKGFNAVKNQYKPISNNPRWIKEKSLTSGEH